ncbi:hypothetical protein OG905_09215 [Streptomyces sp. NBC_00322]|nr:hypothetical protein [Streptomyces sp. NBC_00322]
MAQAIGHGAYGELRRAVHDSGRVHAVRGGGDDVDDVPGAALAHGGQDRREAMQHAAQVHVDVHSSTRSSSMRESGITPAL